MKITITLSKNELDLIEEALLQYQSLLLKTAGQDQIVKDELELCLRVFDEFGMESLPTGKEERIEPSNKLPEPNKLPPGQYPFSR